MLPEVVFADYDPPDFDALVALDARLFGEDAFTAFVFQRLLRAYGLVFRVARADTVLAGYAAAYMIGGTWRLGYIASLAVDLPFQRRGIGLFLMQQVHTRLLAQGALMVKLHVRASNGPAVALYRKLGYTVQRGVPGYYTDGGDALLMLCVLSAP